MKMIEIIIGILRGISIGLAIIMGTKAIQALIILIK